MSAEKYKLTESPYGFAWGPVIVERIMSDPKAGVILHITTDHNKRLEIRVTPRGTKIYVRRLRTAPARTPSCSRHDVYQPMCPACSKAAWPIDTIAESLREVLDGKG